MRFVLDTDTLSLFQRGDPLVVARIADHFADDLGITIITIEEQISGWYTLLRRAKTPAELASAYERLTALVRSLASIPVLTFDLKAAARCQELVGLKLNVGRYDLRIAAITLEHDATLVTRNGRDFSRVPGLRIVDWSSSAAS